MSCFKLNCSYRVHAVVHITTVYLGTYKCVASISIEIKMINNKTFSPSPCDSLVCRISFEKFEKKFLAAFQLKLDPLSSL